MPGMEILAFLYMVPGATFLSFLLYCLLSERMARGHLRDEPFALFFLEFVGPPVAITLGVVFAGLVYKAAPDMIVWLFGVGGLLGWIALAVIFLIQLFRAPKGMPKQPKQRLQFATRDMLGGAIGMGAYLVVAQSRLPGRGFSTASWLAHYLAGPGASPALFFGAVLVLSPLAFLLALDVCRQTAWPMGSRARASGVGCILFVSMLNMPLATFAWARMRWQYLKIRRREFPEDGA